jgi:hypothetical protein
VIESKKDAVLGRVAIAASLVSMLMLFIRNRTLYLNEGWFLPANRAAMACGLIAIVSAIAALTGGRLSRAWRPLMVVALLIGLVVLVYGAWTEILLYFLSHVCWTGSC